MNKTPWLETFGIKFPVDQFVSYVAGATPALSRFCERITAGESGILFDSWAVMNPALENAIRDIVDCQYTGALKDALLLSKGIELLVLSVDAAESTDTPSCLKTAADGDKVIAARDLVNARLTDPPTLSELARQVGLNEYKLKRGFKEMFGATVFTYLTEQRLELPKRYVLDTQKQAAEIAFELGYATPQHFSHAFKKRFGVAPNSMRKTP